MLDIMQVVQLSLNTKEIKKRFLPINFLTIIIIVVIVLKKLCIIYEIAIRMYKIKYIECNRSN